MDILVEPTNADRARAHLERTGWTFERENGVLWRLSAAATYERGGSRVDLHWGLHAAHLPASRLRTLERALWAYAHVGPNGMLEPDPESLLVFLAVHAVGHDFERPEWGRNARVAANLVRDWSRVWALAHEARAVEAVRAALADPPRGGAPLLDGFRGRALTRATWIARGHFFPRRSRDRIREAIALRREGFGLLGAVGARRASFAGLELAVPRGVFAPQAMTETLRELGLEAVADHREPIVVEVGTGSGAVALSLARARPSARVFATDTSYRALACARRNRERLGLANAEFLHGSLLGPLPDSLRGQVAVVLSNIPFVWPRAARARSWQAPMAAIEGPDSDGLGLLRQLAGEARGFLEPGGRLIVQISSWQWTALREGLDDLGYVTFDGVTRPTTAAVFGVAEWSGAGA